MKKILIFLSAMMLVLSLSGGALASTITFGPVLSQPGMPDSDYYIWGIDWGIPEGEMIVSASLTVSQMKNYKNDPNHLYISLLDAASDSSADGDVFSYPDVDAGDYFAGQPGTYSLLDWSFTSTPVDRTHVFDAIDIASLSNYVTNGNFGIGIDPECYYWTEGITLTIETAVPEPATMLLFGTGLIGLAGLGRRKFFKRG